jgi:hypothetical protein
MGCMREINRWEINWGDKESALEKTTGRNTKLWKQKIV